MDVGQILHFEVLDQLRDIAFRGGLACTLLSFSFVILFFYGNRTALALALEGNLDSKE